MNEICSQHSFIKNRWVEYYFFFQNELKIAIFHTQPSSHDLAEIDMLLRYDLYLCQYNNV